MVFLRDFLIVFTLAITHLGHAGNSNSYASTECSEPDDASYIQARIVFSEKIESLPSNQSADASLNDLPRQNAQVGRIATIVCLAIILVFLSVLAVSLSINAQVTTMISFTLVLALTWAGLTQLMRVTQTDAQWSLSLLVTWTNNAMWPLLGIPYACQSGFMASSSVFTSTKFGFCQAFRFYILALATNLCFNASLHFQPASHTTAIFSVSVIFTAALTLTFLKDDPMSKLLLGSGGIHQNAAWIGYTLCVALTVSGVVFITRAAGEPESLGDLSLVRSLDTMYSSLTEGFGLTGPFLSIGAAACIAIYKIEFRKDFGGDMNSLEVGLFLAYLGIVNLVCAGPLLLYGIAVGWIDLDFSQVHWNEILGIAAVSSLYNFILNFGISKTSPITVSLAMQLGIPFNLLLEVLILKEPIHKWQTIGVLLLLCSFSITIVLDHTMKR